MRPTCIYDNLSMINELVEKENEKFFPKNLIYKLCDQLAVYTTEHHKKTKTLYTGYTPQSTVIPRSGYNMFNIP